MNYNLGTGCTQFYWNVAASRTFQYAEIEYIFLKGQNLYFAGRGKISLPRLFFFFFLWLHLWHMEFPCSGLNQSCSLQPTAYTTATTARDPSGICDPCHSLQQHWILYPLSKHPYGYYVGFLTHWATIGTPLHGFWFRFNIMDFNFTCWILWLFFSLNWKSWFLKY